MGKGGERWRRSEGECESGGGVKRYRGVEGQCRGGEGRRGGGVKRWREEWRVSEGEERGGEEGE